jgi:hypothetical protein
MMGMHQAGTIYWLGSRAIGMRSILDDVRGRVNDDLRRWLPNNLLGLGLGSVVNSLNAEILNL